MAKEKHIMSKSIHIALTPENKEKLAPFASKRGKSMTAIVNYSLENLFDQEEIDPARHEALKLVLSRKFSIPRMFTVQGFYVTLYLNATNLPEYSAKDYWKTPVYLSEVDKTCKEIFTEIKEELTRELHGKASSR